MPLTVLVRNPGPTAPPALTFDGDRVVLGRGAFADVRLPDPSVSSRHATVRAVAGEYLLVDEGSTNGTFVGGIRLPPQTPRTIRSGDLVRLGRVWVEIRTNAAPLTYDLPMATRDLAFHLVADAMRAVGDDTSPFVQVVEGPDRGATLSLAEEGRIYVLGRAARCALPLSDTDASREHVQIVRRGSSVLVQDLGSKNQAVLGEAWLDTERPVVWKRPAMLRVAHSVLALREPVAEALSDLEGSEDEVLPEAAAPPQPPSSEAPPGSALETEAAPVVSELPAAPPKVARDASGWSATDLAVGGAAILVILLSAAGLYWLFRS
jgi:pSer/pThr/pTyr-binding forkhead associated (FHA) protein